MPMQLVLDDDSGIPIPLDDDVREAWVLQFDRASACDGVDVLCGRLAECFAHSLAECLDPDLKPPTDPQIRYATDISRRLGIALPAEALRFRGAMAEFIDRFAELDRHRRRKGIKPEPTPNR